MVDRKCNAAPKKVVTWLGECEAYNYISMNFVLFVHSRVPQTTEIT